MNNLSTETQIDYKFYFDKSVSYEKYLQNFQDEIAIGDKSEFAEYLPQNWQRQSRMDRKLKLKEDLQNAVQNLEKNVNWLVINEHWCGDASQINPVINKVVEASNGMISLGFVYRDENEELIDAHLTNGRSRSIPILIELDSDYNVVNTYGPRPAEAQKLVEETLAQGGAYNIPLHTWYAKDKQQAIQDDLLAFIQK